MSRCEQIVGIGESLQAEGVDPVIVDRVVRFLSTWPKSLPLPEWAVEEDGEVCLDWIAARDRVFSVSIGLSSNIAYAGVCGEISWHGVEIFEGTGIPELVTTGVWDVLYPEED
jgi:hypothetical protein